MHTLRPYCHLSCSCNPPYTALATVAPDESTSCGSFIIFHDITTAAVAPVTSTTTIPTEVPSQPLKCYHCPGCTRSLYETIISAVGVSNFHMTTTVAVPFAPYAIFQPVAVATECPRYYSCQCGPHNVCDLSTYLCCTRRLTDCPAFFCIPTYRVFQVSQNNPSRRNFDGSSANIFVSSMLVLLRRGDTEVVLSKRVD